MGHDFVDQCLGDDFHPLCRGIEQTGGSDIVHLPGHPTGIVVDELLGRRFEDFFLTAGFFDTVIDIQRRFIPGHRVKGELQVDAMAQIGVRGAFEGLAQFFLTAKQDFQGDGFVD